MLTFAQVNVPYSDALAHRDQVISLIHPHNTEMDLSIAYALYFASRCQGLASAGGAHFGGEDELRTSQARVLLSGLGADELFGGYGRHAVAFSRLGYPGLVDELLLDVSRLSKRNLGRDDRVMAHWGKEVRFPYLDECLVRWAMETPAWEKCDFDNGEDVSGVEADKRVLRLLALELGMGGVAKEKKRAVRRSDYRARYTGLLTTCRYSLGQGRLRWKADGSRGRRCYLDGSSLVGSGATSTSGGDDSTDTSESRSRRTQALLGLWTVVLKTRRSL
jgi:asparagine synthetase B (glutamine-hydrolysing)